MEVAGHRVPEVIEYTLEETQEFLHAKFYRNLTGSEAMSKVVKNDSFCSRSRRPDGVSFALILEALSTTCLSSTHDDLAQRLLYTFAADQRDECPEVLGDGASRDAASGRDAKRVKSFSKFRVPGDTRRGSLLQILRARVDRAGRPSSRKSWSAFFVPRSSNRDDGGPRPIERPPTSSTVGIRDIPPNHANLV